jgi:hypothetical protein
MRATSIALFVALTATWLAAPAESLAATVQEKCAGAKRKAAGKKIAGKMSCYSKAFAKSVAVDPFCLAKAEAKFEKAFAKAGSSCPGGAAAIEALVDTCVTTLVDDTDQGTPKCQGSSAKAAGKGASSALGCHAKEITKPGTLAACLAKNDGKLGGSLTKAGSCADGDTITDVNDCADDIADALEPTCPGCCTNSQLRFVTGIPDGSQCGSVRNDLFQELIPLECGGLYFGGGLDGVPLPALTPDTEEAITNVTACDPATGALTLGPTTAGETGSLKNCTSTGCYFGPPLPIPNATAVSTSTCVVNVVAQDAAGAGNCGDGSVSSLSLPLASGIYLTGDLLDGSAVDQPNVAGINPCPLCTGGSCQGGPNHGVACVPGSSDLGDPYPTSADCPPPAADFLGNLAIGFNLSTTAQTLTAADLPDQTNVFCGFCATLAGVFENPAHACTSNAECTTGSFTRCRQRNPGAFATDLVTGQTARSIVADGSEPGLCMGDGVARDTTLVSLFCVPPVFNGIVDGSADLPGPGGVALKGQSQLLP